MILYQLRCSSGHEFEGWFPDSTAYDSQVKNGDIACPHCSNINISKAIMAPNISPARSKSKTILEQSGEKNSLSEIKRSVLDSIDAMRKKIEDSCDNVGENFAEEARRIYYGEAEERGIYGKATEEEAIGLDDEGIEFYKIPDRRSRDN